MTKKIILIGGMPTAGKSTIAQALSNHLNLPWVSTDQIRVIMQAATTIKENPILYTPEGYNAERFLTEFTAQKIVDMELKQMEAIWPGVKSLIEGDSTWNQGFIIEGIGILPHLVARDFANDSNVKAVFVSDNNEDRVRDVVFRRGVWGAAKDYSDDVKPKEVEWSLLFGRTLKSQVEKYNYPWVDMEKNGDDLSKVLKSLGLLSGKQ